MELKSTALRTRRGLVGSIVGAMALSVIGIGGMAPSAQAAGEHNIIVKIDNFRTRGLHSFRVLRNGSWSACDHYTGQPTRSQITAMSRETIGIYAYPNRACRNFRGNATDYKTVMVPVGNDGDWTVTL